MATEKRLIDANAFREFLEVIRQEYRDEDTLSSGFAACLIETVQDEYLALAPTVDAVEVVRCKDCKHYDNSVGIQWCKINSKFYPGGFDWHSFPKDGFCSYGERKDND